MSVDSLSFRLDELTDLDMPALASRARTHTHTRTRARTLRLFIQETSDIHMASVHSSLFVSIFHTLLHPHHSPYNS